MRCIFLHEILLASVMMLVFQAGCGYQNRKTVVRPQEIFDSKEIAKITILPVADGRREIDKRVNFEKEISKVQERLIACLKEKGYDCVAITDTAAIAIDPQQIPFADAASIAEIGPDASRWVMVPIVDRLDNPYLGGYDSLLDCYLFDKRIGKLVWEGSASGWVRGSDYCLEDAFYHLMKEFPEKSR